MNTKKVKKLWKRSLFGDYDGDGVMNAFDCQPKNKKRQDSDCPRCKQNIEEGMHALSRRDNKTKICSDCGTDEALSDWAERS